jgi:hypothetical protein
MTPEVLVEFESPVLVLDGASYRAQACGAEMSDGSGMWEGWIEFIPIDGGRALRSPRETTQSNRDGAAYWATGLSAVYLDGALQRALKAGSVTPANRAATALFDGPAPADAIPIIEPEVPSVLDPFSVYQKGERLLRGQLNALSSWHLVNIIQAYELSAARTAALEAMSHDELVELIVTAVRRPALEPDDAPGREERGAH